MASIEMSTRNLDICILEVRVTLFSNDKNLNLSILRQKIPMSYLLVNCYKLDFYLNKLQVIDKHFFYVPNKQKQTHRRHRIDLRNPFRPNIIKVRYLR